MKIFLAMCLLSLLFVTGCVFQKNTYDNLFEDDSESLLQVFNISEPQEAILYISNNVLKNTKNVFPVLESKYGQRIKKFDDRMIFVDDNVMYEISKLVDIGIDCFDGHEMTKMSGRILLRMKNSDEKVYADYIIADILEINDVSVYCNPYDEIIEIYTEEDTSSVGLSTELIDSSDSQEVVFFMGIGWSGGMGSYPIVREDNMSIAQKLNDMSIYIEDDFAKYIIQQGGGLQDCYSGTPVIKVSANITLRKTSGNNYSIRDDEYGESSRQSYYEAYINELYDVDIEAKPCSII